MNDSFDRFFFSWNELNVKNMHSLSDSDFVERETMKPEERAQRVMETFESMDEQEMAPMIEASLNARLHAYTLALFEELENERQ